MVEEIRWADNAIADYHSIVDYLLKNWTIEIASRFIAVTEHKIRQLSLHPDIGIRSLKAPDVRSILITKHNRLYYRIETEPILEILRIYDTRQNPAKNEFE